MERPVNSLNGLVSVITPSHNSGAVIERAVRSVAAQTIGVLEHIVIDDGSIDGTAGIIRGLQAVFPRLRYVHQTRQGAAAARNAGIEAARGRYIAFLDSDDYWGEGKLESQIGYMESTGASFTYGDYQISDPITGTLRVYRAPDTLGYRDLLGACPIGCLTAAYNQAAFGKVYMPLVRRGQDWGLWLNLTRDGTPAFKYPGIEAIYFSYPESLSSNKLLKCLDMYRVFRRQERLSPSQSVWYLMQHAWPMLRNY